MKITKIARNKLIKDAEKKYPYECCGFVFGPTDEEINEVLVIDNKRKNNKERRFLMDPNDYIKAENYAENSDLKLVGIYHSHPDHKSEPSDFDEQNALPNLSYLILSVRKGQFDNIQSWRMNDERNFLEEIID